MKWHHAVESNSNTNTVIRVMIFYGIVFIKQITTAMNSINVHDKYVIDSRVTKPNYSITDRFIR